MTGRAVLWGGSVEEHGLAFDGACQLVTCVTTNVLVRPLQWKVSPLVVIKQRWLPLCAIVALGARRDSALDELPAVNVLMALLAFRRRRFKVDIDQAGFLVGRLMAVHASGGAMRAKQREGSFGVIET